MRVKATIKARVCCQGFFHHEKEKLKIFLAKLWWNIFERAMFRFSHQETQEQRAERLMAQGERLIRRGKESEGIQKLREAAELLPEVSSPNVRLGRIYAKRQEYDLALEYYYKGLFFCGMDDEAGMLCEIAFIYLHIGRYDLAEEKFLRALQIIPDFQVALQGAARLYLHTGQISEAITMLKKMPTRDAFSNEALLQLVDALRRSGAYQQARELVRELLAYSAPQTPEDIEALQQMLRECAFPDGEEFGGKELLYARYGAMCLGSADDDGVTIPLLTSGVVTARHIVATLARLLRITEHFGWECRCVVAADAHSRIFAAIAARLLRLPLALPANAPKHEQALFCQWRADAAAGRKALKKLRRRTAQIITCAFVAEAEQDDPSLMPDIVGLPFARHANVAWRNADGTLSSAFHDAEFWGILSHSVEVVINEYCRRVYESANETSAAQQVEFYRRDPIWLRPHLIAMAKVRQALPPAADQVPEQAEIAPDQDVPAFSSLERLSAMLDRLQAQDQIECRRAVKQLRQSGLADKEIDAVLAHLLFERHDDWLRLEILDYWLNAADGYGVDRLMSLYAHPQADIKLKTLVLNSLSKSPDRRISALFVNALSSLDERLRAEAARHLDRLDESQPLSDVFERLLCDMPTVRIPVIRYLADRRSPLLSSQFESLLESDDPAMLIETLTAIRACQDRTCLPQVEALLTRAHPQIQEHALRTLGAIGGIEAAWGALPFLDHPSAEMRVAAVECVMEAEARRSPVFLMERLRQETSDAQRKLFAFAADLGMTEMIPLLLRLAETRLDSPEFTQGAMQAFARLPHPRCLPFARTAAASFPTDDVLMAYLAMVNAVGDETDRDLLIPLLGHIPAIRLRAAALLRRYGIERYGRILSDALNSPKQALKLLTIEALADIADEASLAQLCAAFTATDPTLNFALAKAFAAHDNDTRYIRYLRARSGEVLEQMRQGLLRALQTSQNIEEVIMACRALHLLETDALADIRAYAAPPHSDVLRCGVMRWLASCDGEESRALFHANLTDEHLDVANTAFRLLHREGTTN